MIHWNTILGGLASGLGGIRWGGLGQNNGPNRSYTRGQRLAGAVCGMILCALILCLMVGLPWWWINHLVDSNLQPKPPEPPPQGNSREQPAINAIWAAGGQVMLDKDDPDKPVTWVDLSRMTRRLQDADLDLLKQFKLRDLQVCLVPVTDARLDAVANLGSLESLDLSGTALPDGALERLAPLSKLQGLYLNQCDITDAGLKSIEAFPHLQSLSLKSAKVTDAGLRLLGELADLDYLDLSNTQITDAGLEHLEGLSQLHHLYLDGTQVTDVTLERLKGLQNLDDLQVSYTRVTREGLDGLQKARPRLLLENEQLPSPFQVVPPPEIKNPFD